MPAQVSLCIIRGALSGKRHDFSERTTCIVGRSPECEPKLPGDERHATISRHHCLLDINPPDIRVRDFGSMNGTLVNGQKIGQREWGMTPEEGARMEFPECDLCAGDEIELGETAFRVEIFVPIVCARCGVEMDEPQARSGVERSPGDCVCRNCQDVTETMDAPLRATVPDFKRCAQCGKDAAAEIGPLRSGVFICAECRRNPRQVLDDLLAKTEAHAGVVPAIQGFSLVRELGRGGMGAVYLARSDTTRQELAIKVLLPEIAFDARMKEAFQREVRNAGALTHPNIVGVLNSGESNGAFFVMLEYCDGGSVADWVRGAGGKLSVSESVPTVFQMLDGLTYAHSAEIPSCRLESGEFGKGYGLVHRDLKPGNIFLAGSGTARIAKLGDFGLSKAFDWAGLSGYTRTGSIAGTPHFMPRQSVINFKYAKPEVDVWAAAATFYYMLTGRAPRDFHPGEDPWKVILESPPVPIRKRDRSVSEALAEVIDAALDDQKETEFKTASRLKQALQDVL